MLSTKLYSLGKYLDQPKLVENFSKSVPVILTIGGLSYGTYDIYKTKPEERKNRFIKNLSTLSFTVISALLASHGIEFIKKANGNPLIKGLLDRETHDISGGVNNILQELGSKGVIPDKKLNELLNKAKSKVLNLFEIDSLSNELKKISNNNEKLISHIIPEPKNLTAKEIFGEIKNLSLLGFVPVAGAITGGIIGDKLTDKNWKKHISDKLKEGFYQFFANIFLCNIGAGIALFIMEKAKVKSSIVRGSGMLTGIVLTGVLGGSAIANFLSKNFINPIFDKGFKKAYKDLSKNKICFNHLYSERHPEPADIALHVDDLATVSVLSGLKWIGPALPIIYSFAAYRAGIGYRNGNKS